jgi:hypothetical protein
VKNFPTKEISSEFCLLLAEWKISIENLRMDEWREQRQKKIVSKLIKNFD